MRKVGLVLVISLLASLILLINVNADTSINGEITTDTIWDTAGSPYVFDGDVIVKENVNLTILPGVTVNMGSFALQVNGTLKVQCNSSNPIVFDSTSTTNASQIIFDSSSADWNATDNTGCIIESATIKAPISINGSSPKIVGCVINGGILINQSSATILRNTISVGNTTAAISIEQESSPTIQDNIIWGKTIGISLNLQNNNKTNTFNPSIENNTISNCATAIGIGESNGTISLHGNLIFGSTSAVKIGNTTATVHLQHNLIMNNTHGFDVGAGVTIYQNTIYNNTIGIYYDTPALSTISYNNIMNNTEYNIEVTINSPDLLEATYNYWGTLSIPTINASIYDYNDNSTLGEVKYLPALGEPSAEAPIIPGVDMSPSPAPTPTPTATPIPTQTIKPTPSKTPTPTATPDVTQGQFGPLEIGIIAALVIVIVIFLIVVLKRNSKKDQPPTETSPTNMVSP